MIHNHDIIGVALAASAPAAVAPLVAGDLTGISWLSVTIAMLVAFCAGIVKYLIDRGKEGESKFEVVELLSYGGSGLLAGLFVYLFVSYLGIHPNLILMSTGFAGYSGEIVLKMGPVKWVNSLLNNDSKTP